MRPILPARAAEGLRRIRTPRAVVRISFATLVLLWLIVPSGAVVRLTASGLGCPQWPLCEKDAVVPETAGHALIEFSNRVLSAVVAAAAVITWLIVRRAARAPRGTRRWAGAVAIATAGQVPLGGITVMTGLHPMAVASHFLLSMIALGCGTMLLMSARDWRDGRRRAWERRRGVLAGLVCVAAATVLTTGTIVTGGGPHPGDNDVTRRFGDLLLAVDIHVRAAIAFTALAAVLVAWVWREGGVDRLTARLTIAALPLIAIQIALGEYQYRNGLPWQVVVFHVTTAGLVWACIVGACNGVARPAREPAHALREATLWQGTQRTESGSALSRPSGISTPQSTQIP